MWHGEIITPLNSKKKDNDQIRESVLGFFTVIFTLYNNKFGVKCFPF
ncbi:hypothetical protein LNTAR_04591 [Lentisphaera araneosa HTCC2155]|uniref:Uncharacterized protein n=1 Tax=Lentisphaera araneosa HTCC2155 TaxID=313628 RepID=A6DQL7_9BACT|nr:hypothetical protein LNTAR_04591 [Lentisphaera araneosa HTCC2155]